MAMSDDIKHVVGNAAFALETNLGCINVRLAKLDDGEIKSELQEICGSMQESLEKIKEFIHENQEAREKDEAWGREYDRQLQESISVPRKDEA